MHSSLRSLTLADTGHESDSEDSSSSESGISDHTFHADEEDAADEISDSDASSFVTTDSGRWTMEELPSLLNELSDIR